MKKIYNVCFFFVVIFLISHCTNNQTKEIKKSLKDPSVLEIQELFDSHKYKKLIKTVERFYASTNTKKVATPLYYEALTFEKIAKTLNTTNASQFNKYKKLFYRKKNQYVYNGEAYLSLFNEFPKSTFAENAYNRYWELNNPFDNPTQKSVKKYIALIKEFLKKHTLTKKKQEYLQKELFKSYRFLSGLDFHQPSHSPINKSYFKQLSIFADSIIKKSHNLNLLLSAYESKLAISLFNNKKNESLNISKKIIKLFPDKKISIIPHYILGNYFYTRENLKKSLIHYKQTLKLLSQNPFTTTELLSFNINKADMKHFKQEIYKKIKVISSELAYNQVAQNHRIGMVTGNIVRLRSSQDAKSSKNVITSLNTGDKVVILKQSKSKKTMEDYTDYWYYVRMRNGQDGWIFGKYLLIF